MRILMLSQFYPPIIGGEEHHVRALSRALATVGHDVAVATLQQEELAACETDQGVRIHRLRGTVQRVERLFTEAGRRQAPPFPDPESVWALRHVIAREHPDIVHAHNWLIHSFLPLKSWRRTGLLLTLHDYSLSCAKKRLMYRGVPCSGPGFTKCLGCAAHHYGLPKGVATALSTWAMQPLERVAVDLFLPVSRAVAIGNRLEESRLPYRVIPNFVPDDVAVPKEDTASFVTQLPPDGYLMFAGDLGGEKGVGVLLQAYAQLSSPPPLVLIGRPSSGAPTNIPPNVTVLHSWPHYAVMEAWRRSLVALVPSIWPDPCPTVVMEAMASGRPVIGSQIGGISDLILDGETGLLVPPADATALRQALERILSDTNLRARLGQGALRRIVEFQARTVVPRIEQAYRDVLRARDAPQPFAAFDGSAAKGRVSRRLSR
jgi:glycosyltransferase involved in cell wall biosynthesis